MATIKPRYWDWTMPGAPILDRAQKNGINDILKACLVGDAQGKAFDGQNSAGWKVLHEDVPTNILVLQNSTTHGFGTVVWLNDSSDHSLEYRAAEGWDGTAVVDPAGTASMFAYRGGAGATQGKRRWFLVADERGFFLYHNGTAEFSYPMNSAGAWDNPLWNLMSVGDFTRYDGVKSAYQIGSSISGTANNSRFQWTTGNTNTSQICYGLSRNLVANAFPTNAYLQKYGDSRTSYSMLGGSTVGVENPTSPNGVGVWSNAYSIRQIDFNYSAIGVIRGLYIPMTALVGANDIYPGARLTPLMEGLPSSIMVAMGSFTNSTPVSGQWGILGVETVKSWDIR